MMLKLPSEVLEEIATRAKKKRQAQKLSQQDLADKSGVSFGSVKRFETTGKISMESLLQIAVVLDSLEDFDLLFKADATPRSLDDILKSSRR
ncbi:helix-turn-helix domain-containing protein [Marinoscillum sp.]|uniref:helix-turn-helix domain-containing protein n=1 Tax=Marinoscillum sp. TaxID=2024838 RepID=UPI003BAD9883